MVFRLLYSLSKPFCSPVIKDYFIHFQFGQYLYSNNIYIYVHFLYLSESWCHGKGFTLYSLCFAEAFSEAFSCWAPFYL